LNKIVHEKSTQTCQVKQSITRVTCTIGTTEKVKTTTPN